MLILSAAVVLVMGAGSPEVALLCAAGDQGDWAELRFARVGATEVAPPVARFDIVSNSSVTGALLPKSHTVFAVAQLRPNRDSSWSFSLLRLEPGKPAVELVSRIADASRPTITLDGRLFVQRGRPAEQPDEAQLSIDEVTPGTGRTRSIFTTRGAFAFIAGAWAKELIVYIADAHGGRLEAVNLDTLQTRTLRASMPVLAHDFVIDSTRGALLYTLGDPIARTWHVEQLELSTLKIETLAEGRDVALLPTVFPDGRIAIQREPGGGLVEVKSDRIALPSHGPGYERVFAFTGNHVIGLHEVPGDFPTAFFDAERLPTPTRMRLDIAGVIP